MTHATIERAIESAIKKAMVGELTVAEATKQIKELVDNMRKVYNYYAEVEARGAYSHS